MIKQLLLIGFGTLVVAVFTLLGTVTAPLYSDPIGWGVALSRFYVALPFILLAIIFIVWIWKRVESIDEEKEEKNLDTIKQALREVLAENIKPRNTTKNKGEKASF